MLSFIFTSVRSSSSWFTVAVCSLQHGSGLGSLSPLCWVCGIAQQLCRAEGVVLLLKRFQIKPQNSTPAAYTRNIYRTLNPLLAGLCWSNTHSPVLVLSFLWQWWHNQQSTADVKQFLLITDKFLLIKPSWVSSSSSGAQLQWVFLMQPILGASTLRPTAQSHFFREVADCSQHAKPGKKAGPTSALDLSKQVCMYTYLNCFAFMAPFVLMTQCVMKSYSGLVWCADHWLPQGNAPLQPARCAGHMGSGTVWFWSPWGGLTVRGLWVCIPQKGEAEGPPSVRGMQQGKSSLAASAAVTPIWMSFPGVGTGMWWRHLPVQKAHRCNHECVLSLCPFLKSSLYFSGPSDPVFLL